MIILRIISLPHTTYMSVKFILNKHMYALSFTSNNTTSKISLHTQLDPFGNHWPKRNTIRFRPFVSNSNLTYIYPNTNIYTYKVICLCATRLPVNNVSTTIVFLWTVLSQDLQVFHEAGVVKSTSIFVLIISSDRFTAMQEYSFSPKISSTISKLCESNVGIHTANSALRVFKCRSFKIQFCNKVEYISYYFLSTNLSYQSFSDFETISFFFLDRAFS